MKAKQNGFVCLRIWLTASVCVIGLILQGCADVPEHMRVTEGVAPANLDKDVRFRTTYYFRVYDYCYNAKSRQQFQPVTDSLYRFEMTGKANAYGNHVRFESGTLKSSQIDPFGATIERDEQSGRMRYVPEAEVQARAQRNEAIEEVEALITLKERLIELNKTATGIKNEDGVGVTQEPAVSKSTFEALDKKIVELTEGGLSFNKVPATPGETTPEQARACPPGSDIQRGFQIMGPQGVKTFNQDERLIMAMSSNAKPLLAALQEVSGRMLKSEEAKRSVSDLLLPLVREQLRVSDLDRILLRQQEPKTNDEVTALLEGLSDRLTKGDNGE